MAGGARLVTTTSLIRPSGAVCQARVLEGAELLVASACFSDVLFVAIGTVHYATCYTCCSGGVGLLVIVASRARDCLSALRARLAVSYAPVCCIATGGADLFLASLVSCGEVVFITISFSNTLPCLTSSLLKVWVSIFTGGALSILCTGTGGAGIITFGTCD